VLYDLERSRIGDRIEVLRADWSRVVYEVVAKEAFTKTDLPVDELFRESGDGVLTLITCGGAYTPGRGYAENLVITAVPQAIAPPSA
jgi:sortase (surface protein transpeptidase)